MEGGYMPPMDRKRLEQLGRKGVTLPLGIPKDWKAYDALTSPDERCRVKRVIRELHAKHCPPGCFQENSGDSVSSVRGRGGFAPPLSRSSSRSFR